MAVSEKKPRWALWIGTSVVVAWLGMVVHNITDLPGQTLLSPETLFPSLVFAALLGLWFVPRLRTAAMWALLVWAVVSLVGGGILSVLPLPFLPFVPDQSPAHYLFHLFYAASQVPVIAVCTAGLRVGVR